MALAIASRPAITTLSGFPLGWDSWPVESNQETKLPSYLVKVRTPNFKTFCFLIVALYRCSCRLYLGYSRPAGFVKILFMRVNVRMQILSQIGLNPAEVWPKQELQTRVMNSSEK